MVAPPDHYAVIGNPISHSKSPYLHTLFAAQTKQQLTYEPLLAPLEGFVETVQAFMAAGGRGMNVTVPFKEAAWQLSQRRSPRAELAGAVNTLKFDHGEIFGDNTDGAGLVRDLSANLHCAIRGKRILLLGAGGAARGVIMPLLAEQPDSLIIANRTAPKALALARQFSLADRTPVTGLAMQELAGRRFDLVINATSAGLSDSALDLPEELYAADALAYDMLYGRETAFLKQARLIGVRCADGLGMLVEQAAEAFALWRGIRPDTAPVLASLRQA